MKEKVAQELKQNFRAEFLNRIDATVVFRSLTVDEIRQIVDLMLARVRDQLRAQQLTLEVTQEAKDHIIKIGYDVAYGARPLLRVIQNMIEDPLAEQLLLSRYEPGQTVIVDKDPDAGLSIHRQRSSSPSAPSRHPTANLARRQPKNRGTRGEDPVPIRLQNCGEAFLRWEGQCRNCGVWNSLVETLVREPAHSRPRRCHRLPASGPDRTCRRRRCGSAAPACGHRRVRPRAWRRPVPGSLVLVGGERGVGKSTLLLQVAAGLATTGSAGSGVLYATGEESAAQVRLRAGRLDSWRPRRVGRPGHAESEVGRVTDVARAPIGAHRGFHPDRDARQVEGPPAASSSRESAFGTWSSRRGTASRSSGRPRDEGRESRRAEDVEHLVDAVLALKASGRRRSDCCARQNRFGSTEEIGVFEMGEEGLRGLPIRPSPSSAIMPQGHRKRCRADTRERPLLVEVKRLSRQVDRVTAADRERRRSRSLC
jgi:hypothetical protein